MKYLFSQFNDVTTHLISFIFVENKAVEGDT
jgi:hypothetical protein